MLARKQPSSGATPLAICNETVGELRREAFAREYGQLIRRAVIRRPQADRLPCGHTLVTSEQCRWHSTADKRAAYALPSAGSRFIAVAARLASAMACCGVSAPDRHSAMVPTRLCSMTIPLRRRAHRPGAAESAAESVRSKFPCDATSARSTLGWDRTSAAAVIVRLAGQRMSPRVTAECHALLDAGATRETYRRSCTCAYWSHVGHPRRVASTRREVAARSCRLSTPRRTRPRDRGTA